MTRTQGVLSLNANSRGGHNERQTMSKAFFLVDPSSKEIRRESDAGELSNMLKSMWRRANPNREGPLKDGSGAYAAHTRDKIKAMSPESFQLTDATSVCYREPPKEERPRS